MKTRDELQAAVDEIREVCRRHGVVLVGTCESEMIYGEISVTGNDAEAFGWADPHKQVDNTVRGDEKWGFKVGGIGDWAAP